MTATGHDRMSMIWRPDLLLPLLLPLLLASPAGADDGEALFEEALFLERIRGDLEGAKALYRRVLREGDEALAARSRLRLATCLEKEGRIDEAIEILHHLLRQDVEQKGLVRLALEKLRHHQQLAEQQLQVAEEVRRFQDERLALAGQLEELQRRFREALDDLEASKESREQLAAELARKEGRLQERIGELEEEIGRREGFDRDASSEAIEDRARQTLGHLASLERVRQEQRERLLEGIVGSVERLLEARRPEEAMDRIEEGLRLEPDAPALWRLMARIQSQIEETGRGAGTEGGRAVLRIHGLAAVRDAFEGALTSIRLPPTPPGADPADFGIDTIGLWREGFEGWLRRQLTSTVRPGRWSDPETQIRLQADDLLIRAEPDVHDEVAAFLVERATAIDRVLVVQVRVLLYGRGFLEELTGSWDLPHVGAAAGFSPSGSVLRTMLDPEREGALLAGVAAGRAQLLTAAPLPLLAGQNGSVSLLGHSVAVVDQERRRIADREIAQPIVQRLAEGVLLHLTTSETEVGPRLVGRVRSTRLVRPLPGISTRMGSRQVPASLGQEASFEIQIVSDRTHLLIGLASPLEAQGPVEPLAGPRLPHMALLLETRYLPTGGAPGAAPIDLDDPPPADRRTHSLADLIEPAGEPFAESGPEDEPRPPLETGARDVAAALSDWLEGGSATLHPAGDALVVEGPAPVQAIVARFLTGLRIHRQTLVRTRLAALLLSTEAHDALFAGGESAVATLTPEAMADLVERSSPTDDRVPLPGPWLLGANARLARASRLVLVRHVAGFERRRPATDLAVPREEVLAEGMVLAVRGLHPTPDGGTHLTIAYWLGRNLGHDRIPLADDLEILIPRLRVQRGLARRTVAPGHWLVVGDLAGELVGAGPDERLVLAFAPSPIEATGR